MRVGRGSREAGASAPIQLDRKRLRIDAAAIVLIARITTDDAPAKFIQSGINALFNDRC
jgi:hypothetical protein